MTLDPLESPFGEDLALARAAGRGEARACTALAERLFERVRATVHYLVAGDRDAEDMVQVALLQVLRSAVSYRGECRLERWADRIVVRTALRRMKRRRFRERIVTLKPEPTGEAGPDQEWDAARRQMKQRLARLLTGLKPEQRTVVVLHWVHGYTVSEIAEATETPFNTVRDRLRVGKRKLRKSILKDPVLKDWAGAMNHDR